MNRPQVVTLSTKGQLVLPRSIRAKAGLHAGASLQVNLEPDGTISIRPVRGSVEAFFHALDGASAAGPAAVDEAILQSIQELDDASRHR
jgi:AbrB family looped-hinge helix DNA binding protein